MHRWRAQRAHPSLALAIFWPKLLYLITGAPIDESRVTLRSPPPAAAMRQAVEESDVGGSQPREQGGFLVRDPSTGAFAVARLSSSERDSLAYPICADGLFLGQEIVGTFHTHPNTGHEWRQEPSPQDIRLSKEYPETMGPHQFVISRETIYHIDNDGLVSAWGRTAELLKLEPKETNS